MTNTVRPVIGQEAICPRGLGRIVAVLGSGISERWKVREYVDPRESEWDPLNVKLVPIVTKSATSRLIEAAKKAINCPCTRLCDSCLFELGEGVRESE